MDQKKKLIELIDKANEMVYVPNVDRYPEQSIKAMKLLVILAKMRLLVDELND